MGIYLFFVTKEAKMWRYLGIIINYGKCTCEFKSRIAMAKAAFNRNYTFHQRNGRKFQEYTSEVKSLSTPLNQQENKNIECNHSTNKCTIILYFKYIYIYIYIYLPTCFDLIRSSSGHQDTPKVLKCA
jgi:hypothetical protein